MFRFPHVLLTLLLTGFTVSAVAADTDKLVVQQTNGNTKECTLAKGPVVTFTNNTTVSITTGDDNAQLFFGAIADLQKLTFVGGVAENTNSSSSSPATGGQVTFPTVPSVSYPKPASLLHPRQVTPAIVEPVDTPVVEPVDTPVVKPNLSDAEVVFVNGDSLLYTGFAIWARLSITINGVALSLNKDFTVEYSNNINPGTATVTITGTGDYEGTITRTFTIYLEPRFAVTINGILTEPVIGELAVNKAPATFTSSFGSVSISNYYALAGETVTLTVTPSEDYQIDRNSIQPGLTGDDPEDLSAERQYSYAMSGNGAVNLSFLFSEKPKFFDFTEATVTITDDNTYVYTGDSIKKACVVTYGETPLTEGTDYTLTYANNVNAGTATVTATGLGSYVGSSTATFTISKVPLTVMANDTAMVYGAELPKLTYTITGFVNDETDAVLTKQPVVATDATAASPVGEYPITVSGAEAANYEIAYEGGKLTVTKAMLTVKADAKTMVYGEELPEPTVQFAGFVNDEDSTVLTKQPVITTEATAMSPVGEYDIIVSGAEAANYEIAYESGKLTVTKAMLTVKADAKTKVYGEELPELTIDMKGFVNDETVDVLTKQPVPTTEATATSPVGEYDITVSGGEAANYDFTYEPSKLTITPRSIVGSTLTLDAEKYPYTSKPVEPTVTVQCGSAILTEGTDFTATATHNTEPGTATLTVTGQGNYEGQMDTTFVIYLKPTVEVFINDSAVVEPTTLDNKNKAEFVTLHGKVVISDYYALPGSTVTLAIEPEVAWLLSADSIEVSEPIEVLLSQPTSYVATYVVPEDGVVTVSVNFSVDSVYVGVKDRMADVLRFEIVDGKTVRVLGARETAPVSVFDARGQQVAAEVVRSERELLVRLNRQPQGLYIIKVNNKTFKVYRK